METRIVYFDETGDDGNNTKTSDTFILTSTMVAASDWQICFDRNKQFRRFLHEKYGFSYFDEFHTKPFLYNKYPYRFNNWAPEQRREIVFYIAKFIAWLDVSIVNVIIDKTKIRHSDYEVLRHALTYNIQRIENSSGGNWNYLGITDPGRTASMKKTARLIRAYNPIPSFDGGVHNQPIKYMIEDILEKDSKDSCFIQISDFVSYFVHQYYKVHYLQKEITGRPAIVISPQTVDAVIEILRCGNVLNTKASKEEHGFVIYPK